MQFFSLKKSKAECPTRSPVRHAKDLPDSSDTPPGVGGEWGAPIACGALDQCQPPAWHRLKSSPRARDAVGFPTASTTAL